LPLETLLIVCCVLVFLLAIVLFSPVVIALDSRNRQVTLRWLYFLEFQLPLPGSAGQRILSLFRKAIPIRKRKPAAPPAPAEAEVPKPRDNRRVIRRFFTRCLADSTIRRTLARQVAKLIRRAAGSINVARAESDVSLPDPALNGMLAGAVSAIGGGWARGLRINFRDENNLFIELRFHPFRVFNAFLFFLPGLPYRAMFKVWRALPAFRPQ
jgi:hypothetical protein